jgi:hypothetical protein
MSAACGIEADAADKEEIEECRVAAAKATTATTLRAVIAQERATVVAKSTAHDTCRIAARVKVLVDYFESMVSKLNIARRWKLICCSSKRTWRRR